MKLKTVNKCISVIMILFFVAISLIIYKFPEKDGIEASQRCIRLKEFAPNTDKLIPVRGASLKYFEERGIYNKTHRIRVDENGFIMPSRIYYKPDLTLAFLGGSTTASMRVDERRRFPYAVGSILTNKLNKRVNSYNAGVDGGSTSTSLNTLINKIVPLRPDYVIMMHNVNDLVIQKHEGTYWNDNPFRSLILTHTDEKTNETDEFARTRNTEKFKDSERMISEFKDNLQAFVNICRAYNIKPVLMTQGNRLTEYQDDDMVNAIRRMANKLDMLENELVALYLRYNLAIIEIAWENNITLIDLDKNVGKSAENYYDMYHLTDVGSKETANVIAGELINLIKGK